MYAVMIAHSYEDYEIAYVGENLEHIIANERSRIRTEMEALSFSMLEKSKVEIFPDGERKFSVWSKGTAYCEMPT